MEDSARSRECMCTKRKAERMDEARGANENIVEKESLAQRKGRNRVLIA